MFVAEPVRSVRMSQVNEPTGLKQSPLPDGSAERAVDINASIWRLMVLAWSIVPRRYLWLAGGVFLLSAVSGLIDLAGIGAIFLFAATAVEAEAISQNETVQRIMELFALESPTELMIALGIVSVVLIILRNVVMFAEGAAQSWFRFTVERTLARELLERYVFQPISFFHDVNTTDLSRNILTEVRRVTAYLLEFLVMGSGLIGTLIIVAGVVKELKSPSLIAFGVIALLYGFFYIGVRRYLVNIGQNQYAFNGRRFVAASQALESVRESKLYGVENVFLERFDGPSQEYLISILKSRLLNLLPRHTLEIIVTLGFAVIVLLQFRAEGGIEGAISGLVLVITAFYRIMPRIDVFVRSILSLKVTNAAVVHIVEALKMPIENIDRDPGKPKLNLGSGISINNVTFRYNRTETPAVANIDLEIPSKGMIGIVGPSGAGKSTLVELITGLLSPVQGNILIDGQPLDQALMGRWRGSIAYVAQDPVILDDDVFANIAFGLPADIATTEALRNAAQLAQLDEFVSELPQGYRTRVGENGSNLSGGQRQRMALARALIRDAQLIILDEATNALDPRSEQAIIQAVQTLSKDRLVLVIAHGLSFVKVCDRVIHLQSGSLKGFGSYEALIDNDPSFRAMANLPNRQASPHELADESTSSNSAANDGA